MTDSDNAFLDLIHLAKTAPLELAKTVIRLFRNHTKLVTIILYVTVTPAGTLLCQGRHYPAWDSNECEVLRGIVSAFVLNQDFEVFYPVVTEHPAHFH